MALITISGQPGCRTEEVARITAQRLGWELITQTGLRRLIQDEFGESSAIPDRAYPFLVLSIISRLAKEHHLVAAASGADSFSPRHFPALLRVRIVAPESWRIGALMVDRRLERSAARTLVAQLESSDKAARKQRGLRVLPSADDFDVVLNASAMDSEQMAAVIQSAIETLHVGDAGFLSASADAQLQFQVRLELAKHGISPPDRVQLKRAQFVHPSEEIFANLLDYYRIAWEYEPRSFPIQWDKNGKVLEAFTPDFYLPEFDIYVELTTMKQSNVTKKNRKIKLLRTIYPDVNIQVFYQKDFQNLIFKYGLAERLVEA
jgi:hypoxanthine phosphoribosyltransferase